MKKYLKYIKTLQLAKGILAGSIFLIYSSYALASDNKLYFLTGKVDTIESDSSDCSVSVVSQGLKSWMYTDKKNICDFLQNAKDFDQKVNFEYTLGNGYESIKVRNKLKGVSFAGKQSIWFTNETLPSTGRIYGLSGMVENVYINNNDSCYIAIAETSKGKRQKSPVDRRFNLTEDEKICRLAEDAFYLGLDVELGSYVEKGYSRVYNLKLTNVCRGG
ncbi:hypothetical protein [Wolbachia endosymbiont of Oryzaephilus surinamensis]|uniref:hypothetical protein n=1 Tax=Wolbachia endosymbiont of Oryzaephilus surinamensis TaxID=573241 RepID=UPI0021D52459|nr:hypothetical protein [Wolbachia endosymbiont of Oryzaephilus surinamensis]UXX40875.1 hypothetical protein MJ631_02745 [Wolbachia endosymbiont of Oryzaephilus surinamensis]